jgi:hypothetical protein
MSLELKILKLIYLVYYVVETPFYSIFYAMVYTIYLKLSIDKVLSLLLIGNASGK